MRVGELLRAIEEIDARLRNAGSEWNADVDALLEERHALKQQLDTQWDALTSRFPTPTTEGS